MEHVMVGYDGSPASQSALAWVAERSEAVELEVRLVLVDNLLFADHVRSADVLARGAELLQVSAPGARVRTQRLDGRVPGTLVEEANSAELLVLGVRGARASFPAMTASMPVRAGAAATIPTCLVPATWQPARGPIVVGVDEHTADAAIRFAASEAVRWGEDLVLVHAWLLPSGAGSTPSGAREGAATHRALLTAAATRVAAEFPALRVEQRLHRDNAVSGLAAAAQQARLLVLGTHGRGRFLAGLLGSVGWDLAGRVHSPLCIVPRRG